MDLTPTAYPRLHPLVARDIVANHKRASGAMLTRG